MKTLMAIFFFVFAASLPAYAEDMQKYLSDTETLANEGKHKEALDRFLWFHDHALEHDPDMYGVRLSFALSYWKELGDVYPPALEALKKTRNDKTNLMEQGKGNRDLFVDIAALNETLADDARTVDLFRKLDHNQPDLAGRCWFIAKESVIKAKDYELARKYIGNPVREFGKIQEKYDELKEMYGMNNTGNYFKYTNENSFVEETLRLIDMAIALGDAKAAKEIQAKALAILDDNRLRDALSKDKNADVQQKHSSSETVAAAKDTVAASKIKGIIYKTDKFSILQPDGWKATAGKDAVRFEKGGDVMQVEAGDSKGVTEAFLKASTENMAKEANGTAFEGTMFGAKFFQARGTIEGKDATAAWGLTNGLAVRLVMMGKDIQNNVEIRAMLDSIKFK